MLFPSGNLLDGQNMLRECVSFPTEFQARPHQDCAYTVSTLLLGGPPGEDKPSLITLESGRERLINICWIYS
jgi:hypothetical protein